MFIVDSRWEMFTVQFFWHFCMLEKFHDKVLGGKKAKKSNIYALPPKTYMINKLPDIGQLQPVFSLKVHQ